jgi:hypothetical protein
MKRIVRRRRMVPRPLDQRMPPMPPDRRSWSSKDARATHASRGRHLQRRRASRDRRSNRRTSWPPPPLPTPTAPRTTVVATGPRVRRRRRSALGAPSPLARPPRERHCHSFLVERYCRSPNSGRHRRWPLGSPPLKRNP